jgi:hypothetical protein
MKNRGTKDPKNVSSRPFGSLIFGSPVLRAAALSLAVVLPQ